MKRGAVLLGTTIVALLASLGVCAAQTRSRAAAVAQPSAGQAYKNARMALGSSSATSDDEVARRLTPLGFARVGDDWVVSDSEGQVVVTGVPGAFHTITFVPTQRRAMPDGLVASLSAKAERTGFLGPKEYYFVFSEDAPHSGPRAAPSSYDEWVCVSLVDGAWLRTIAWIVFN